MAKLIINPFTGIKHLPGSSLCMHVTACGEIDAFEQEINGTIHSEEGIEQFGVPDCAGCLDAAMEIFTAITKKEFNAVIKAQKKEKLL
jgi:hypothetical protein